MKLRLLFFAWASAAALSAADAVPLFNATLTVGREHRFVLIDAAGKTSSFLRVGESFGGYTLKAYDPKTGVLELERDGKVARVTLVADATVVNAPAMTPATVADAQAVLNTMKFEEMMDRMLAQQKKMAVSMAEQMTRANAPAAAREDVLEFQRKLVDVMMGSFSGAQMKDDMARVYSEVFTKEELAGLAAFYSTPLGEALNAKQPEIQQKMSELMAPRIAQVMPKLQQMGREFGAQQKAKREAAAAGSSSPTPAPAAKP